MATSSRARNAEMNCVECGATFARKKERNHNEIFCLNRRVPCRNAMHGCEELHRDPGWKKEQIKML